MTDLALVKACIKCAPKAQRKLYDLHIDIMYNTVFRYTYNRQDTEDILQIAFTRVFKYIKNYDSKKGSLKNWIRKICVRCTLDFLKKKSLVFLPIEESLNLYSENDLVINELETDYILSLIERLPDHYRIIFNMHEVEGYTHQEIANELNINTHSCRVYLARAKKQLKQSILNFQSKSKEISS